MMLIQRAKDEELDDIYEADRVLFEGVPWTNKENSEVWIATIDSTFAGYGSARVSKWRPGWIYFDRCAVLGWARRRGVQKRLIQVRCNWAKRQGYLGAFTYTIDNPASARNLIRCGFLPFAPGWQGWRAEWWERKF